MLILFKISETFFTEMGYILLRIVTQLLVTFRLLLLEQRSQYRRKLKSHVNYRNPKPTHILQKATLIRNRTPRTLILYSSQLVSLHYQRHSNLRKNSRKNFRKNLRSNIRNSLRKSHRNSLRRNLRSDRSSYTYIHYLNWPCLVWSKDLGKDLDTARRWL